MAYWPSLRIFNFKFWTCNSYISLFQGVKEESEPPRRTETETQTDLSLFNLNLHPEKGADPLDASLDPSNSLDLTHRTSGYFSREPSFIRGGGGGGTPLRVSRESTPLNTRRSTPLHNTPRFTSLGYNGNPPAAAVVCECAGCPGNTVYAANGNLEDPEDYLETLDRKVSEIMNKDCSRRSSYHDLRAKKGSTTDHPGDIYGGSFGRKRVQDLNHNPSYLGPAPEGAIRFEEDGRSSEEGLESSQEDLSHAWSDEDSDQYVLRRRRLVSSVYKCDINI